MIGDFLQKEIIKGNVEHHILNAFDVTFNYNLGRNKHCIIEKIQIQPLVNEAFYIRGWNLLDRSQLENELNELFESSINTLRIYDGEIERNYTFKLNIRTDSFRYNGFDSDNLVINVTAQPIEIDVFWIFKGENIVLELFSAEDLFSASFESNGSAPTATRTKTGNPVGSNVPYRSGRLNIFDNISIENLGRKTEIAPFDNRIIEAIVPAIGSDVIGNKFPVKATNANFFDQSFPIISLGACLYEPSKIDLNGNC